MFFQTPDKFLGKDEVDTTLDTTESNDIDNLLSSEKTMIFFYSKNLSLMSLFPLSTVKSSFEGGSPMIPDSIIGLSNMRFVPDSEPQKVNLDINLEVFSFVDDFDFKSISHLVPTFIMFSKDSNIDVHITCFSNSFKATHLGVRRVIPTFVRLGQIFYPTLSFNLNSSVYTIICFSDKVFVIKSSLSSSPYLCLSPFF